VNEAAPLHPADRCVSKDEQLPACKAILVATGNECGKPASIVIPRGYMSSLLCCPECALRKQIARANAIVAPKK
jgi:hypothetical protein